MPHPFDRYQIQRIVDDQYLIIDNLEEEIERAAERILGFYPRIVERLSEDDYFEALDDFAKEITRKLWAKHIAAEFPSPSGPSELFEE